MLGASEAELQRVSRSRILAIITFTVPGVNVVDPPSPGATANGMILGCIRARCQRRRKFRAFRT